MTIVPQWSKLTRLGPFRWSAIAPWRAARVAVGVIVPLAVGWFTTHIDYGAYAALGALPAGFVSFQGETRTRVAAVALASLGMAMSTLVGATAAASAPWLLIPIVAVWGYAAGLTVCLGPWASIAVLQWGIQLLIAVSVPTGPMAAGLRAGLVLAGGLFQAVLVTASWAVWPGAKERSALAASYRALADYASSLNAGKFASPSTESFPAGTALADPNPLLPPTTRLIFIDLLEEAERIRASLAALAMQAADFSAREEGELRALMEDAAAALTLVAEALTTPRSGRLSIIREIRKTLIHRSVPAATWRWAGEALLGQLRAVGRIVANLESVRPLQLTEGSDGAGGSKAQTQTLNQSRLYSIAISLRANLTASSEAGRHALRLGLVAALAEAIAQAAGLYQGRWAALTVFLVLKPDYTSTIYRGVQRALGTAIGAGLGAIAQMTHPEQGGQVVAAGLFIAAAYALFDVNYLLFGIPFTAFVVAILSLLGSPAIPTAEARLLDTFIGAALALVGYLVWPTWEGGTAQAKFAWAVEAQRDYAVGLVHAFAHHGSTSAPQLGFSSPTCQK